MGLDWVRPGSMGDATDSPPYRDAAAAPGKPRAAQVDSRDVSSFCETYSVKRDLFKNNFHTYRPSLWAALCCYGLAGTHEEQEYYRGELP